MAEPARASCCRRQGINFDDFGGHYGRYNELRYAIAATDHHRIRSKVDQEHLHLSAVIGIYCAGCVNHAETMFQGEAASRSHLRLISLRHG